MSRFVIISLVVLVTIGFALSCGGHNPESESQPQSISQNPPSSNPGTQTQTAATPTVARFTAKDIEGNYRNSDEWIGKQPVVINFWGTWCGPCRMEVPDLVKLYDEYHSQGVEILGLAVRDNEARVEQFADEYGMDWPLLMADNSIAMSFKLTGVPKTIFINENGEVVQQFTGLRNYETLKKAFEAIL